MFHDWTDLGSLKHQTDAEVENCVTVCKQAVKQYQVPIASLCVDNAAKTVASKVVASEELKGMKILVLRDPSHCIDLLSKDLAATKVVSDVMAEATEVRNLVKIDRIDSIRKEMNESGVHGEYMTTSTGKSETRMNDCHIFIVGVRNQYNFIQCLPENAKFRQYMKERNNNEKERIDGTMKRCEGSTLWTRLRVMNDSVTVFFKVVHGLCSREDFPLSAYPLLVQALRNEVNKGLNFENGRFDDIFGPGSRKEIADMVRERFNMDGKDPPGRKVGLLSRYQLMAYLVDPRAREWRNKFMLEADVAELVNEMIEMFVDLDKDGSSKTRLLVKRQFMVSLFEFQWSI